jgi:hypothetical protein
MIVLALAERSPSALSLPRRAFEDFDRQGRAARWLLNTVDVQRWPLDYCLVDVLKTLPTPASDAIVERLRGVGLPVD